MNCSTPGFPILHCLPEFAQTYVHWINDAIQPFHPLLSLYPPALNLSQLQSLSNESALQSSSQSIGSSASVSVLPVNIQGWFPLGLTDLISLLFQGHSKVFSSTTIWNCRSFGAQPSLWSNSHICTFLRGLLIRIPLILLINLRKINNFMILNYSIHKHGNSFFSDLLSYSSKKFFSFFLYKFSWTLIVRLNPRHCRVIAINEWDLFFYYNF